MPLDQQEMFVPAPTRRLIVPVGHSGFWGVDSSTKRVAIATISADGLRGGDVVSIPKLKSPLRLAAIRRATASLARDLSDMVVPGVVMVEEPSGFGSRPNPELAYAVGVIVCAVAEVQPTASILFVESSRWKKTVLGFGGIKKPKPGDGSEYRVLTWARERGYAGASWDVADAYAIAEFGRRTFLLEQR